MSRLASAQRSRTVEDGKPLLEAGFEAARAGRASWCPACDTLRYTADMRWLIDLYVCRGCLGPGIGLPPRSPAVDAWIEGLRGEMKRTRRTLVKGPALSLSKP